VRAISLEPGEVDLTFRPGQGLPNSSSIHAIATQGDRAIIAGDFLSYDTKEAGHIARIESDGRYDPTFQARADTPIRAMLLDASG
jgi:hypothetical protein